MSTRLRTAIQTLLWLDLGGWFGAMVFFAGVVAPTAFQVLPSTELAGKVVAGVLPTLHVLGACSGVILALLGFALRRGSLVIVLPLALSAISLFSRFGVTAWMEEIRAAAFGLPGDAHLQERFETLHHLSVGLFTITLAGVVVLAALHARADARASACKKRLRIP